MEKEKIDIVNDLKELKYEYGVKYIKAEFEAEGSRKDELIMLREFVYRADLGLIIKIGGCEAIHDLDQCKLLDATGIMAPMIETPFAMKKYRRAAEKIYKNSMGSVEWIINAETVTCLKNYDSIMTEAEGFLDAVTVGRSDLALSMGVNKKDIESDKIFDATNEFVSKSKNKGLITNFGGNIGVESVQFIKKLEGKIDRFETRKVVLCPSEDEKELIKSIKKALQFEMNYLIFKAHYYNTMSNEDADRIDRLKKQIEK